MKFQFLEVSNMSSRLEDSRQGSEVEGSVSAPTDAPTQDDGPQPTETQNIIEEPAVLRNIDPYEGYPDVAVPYEVRNARTRNYRFATA